MDIAMEQVAVDGLDALNDGLVEAIVNFRSLGDVAQGVIRQILADLLRLQIRKAMMNIAGAVLGGLGGGLSASFSPSASLVSSASNTISSGLPFFAKGTNFAPGGYAVLGEEGPEIAYLPRGSKVIPNHKLNLPGGLLKAAGTQGSTTSDNRSWTFHNTFPAVTNAREARETDLQVTTRLRRQLAGRSRP